MPAVSDTLWRAQDTSPGEVEAAIRSLLVERHSENSSYVPARVLNLVCVVDKQWSGEIANRLRGVGRYHASRTIVCAVEPGRTSLDATASVAADTEPKPGEFALIRETIVIDVGPEHLPVLDTIVDALVVTDLATVVWAPHGHPQAIDALTTGPHGGPGLAQVVLLDSVDDPEPADAVRRSCELTERVYVVDLAWLRSVPWRERVAATFDPAPLRPDLKTISAVTVRHNPDSTVAALLLIGWLGSRLGWESSRLLPTSAGGLAGTLHARRQDVSVRLEPTALSVRGLAGLTLETASGRHLELDRGPGGLRAKYRNTIKDVHREWTVLGASRGEAGILGEGIRQALLRDPTYEPALTCARSLVA